MKLFVETYVSCNDAYSCTILRSIVKVVCKYFKRLRAVCLDYAFAGRGCLQGPVALAHQPNCPLCSFSSKIVGDVGCSCEVV